MFGVTPQGYVRKTYNDWLLDLQTKARTVDYFGANQDLSDNDPIGIAIKLMSYALDQQEQKEESRFYSMYPDTAEGVSLDRVIKIGGETRRGQDYATVTLRFSGANGSPVPVNSFGETAQGVKFKTIASAVVSSGIANVMAQCTTAGKAGIVPAGQITTLSEPIPGISAVTNPEASRGGREVASDVDTKYAYKTKKTGSGASIASMLKALESLKGVNLVHIEINESDAVDAEGRPPHSREVIIDGGDPDEIADVLWKNHVGLKYIGSNEKVIKAINGQEFDVSWNNPVNKDVFVDIVIQSNASWKSSNLVLIKTAVIKYIGGLDTIMQGAVQVQNEYPGLGLGQGLESHNVEAVIKFPGIKDVTVSLGFSAPVVAGSRSLNLLAKERPYTDNAKVNISVL